LILPLAALPLPAALAIWLVLQTLCFLIAVGGLVWLAARVSGRMWLAYLAAAACLAYDPWVNTVVTGQLNAIPLLFIVLGLVALRVRLPGVAGAAVAASLAAKPAGLLLPLAVLANPETRWRAAAGMAAALAAIGLVSTAVLPLQLYYSYYDTVTAKPALPGVSLGVNRIDAPANSSINGQVSFLAQVAGTERLTALECGRAAVFVMLIGAGAWFLFCRKRRPQIVAHDVQALEWSYWICVSLLALPNLWAHHFVLLLVPFAMISATLTRFPRRWWAWSALGLAYLLLAIPLTDIGLRLAALSQNPGWQRLWALAANPPFWGILVLWALNSHLLFSSQRQEKQWVPDIVV